MAEGEGHGSLYQGFSPGARLLIVGIAALIAIANLGFAWFMALEAGSTIWLGPNDIDVLERLAGPIAGQTEGEKVNALVLRTHVIDVQVNIKAVQNKQSLVLVAIGSGFALMALGFALFLIGADGAFKLGAEGAGSKLLVTGTAPGLFCFFLAALLILVGITRTQQFTNGITNFAGPAPTGFEETPDTRAAERPQGAQPATATDDGKGKPNAQVLLRGPGTGSRQATVTIVTPPPPENSGLRE